MTDDEWQMDPEVECEYEGPKCCPTLVLEDEDKWARRQTRAQLVYNNLQYFGGDSVDGLIEYCKKLEDYITG